MSILVVGSIALDSVETPFGRMEDGLGGSAAYFALAANLYNRVALVGVVGDDFPQRYRALLEEKGIGLSGLEVRRWKGKYDYDLNTAMTLDTQLNVFADFQPDLSEAHRNAEHVFLANIDPSLQLAVRRQVRAPKLTVVDTMNYWIEGKPRELAAIMGAVDIVLMNEGEVRQWAGTHSVVVAAKKVLALGPKAAVVKKGEYGSVLFADSGYFIAPAYPLEEVKDPTGAGDSFAGGFIGYLSTQEELTSSSIRKAMIHGTVVASFAVEDFGVSRLLRLTRGEIAARYLELVKLTQFE